MSGPDSDVTSLWERYAGARDSQIRERLIEYYLPFARRMAAHLYGTRIGAEVGFDDYLQYARVGLIESVDRFDISRGVAFETFAGYRVRGAILSGLARETERAAQHDQQRERLTERQESISARWWNATPEANLGDLVELTVGLSIGLLLEKYERPDEGIHANPYQAAEISQLQSILWTLVENLPPRESEIIRGHYLQHREFQEIAHEMNITKGRVSQLHAQALKRMREFLGEQPRIDKHV